MEQLTPCTAVYLIESHVKEILYTELKSHIINGSTSIGSSLMETYLKKLKDFDFYLPWDYRSEVAVAELWKKLGGLPEKSWCDAVDKIMHYAKTKKRIFIDINYSNIMKRDATLVITDPYV